jgi:4-diphosphocytidyl-2-C-methyl-D-erythritol kinase
MVLFPNCKINLGLHVVRKRPDNFHDIESVFYPLQFKDVLEVVEATQDELHVSGLPLPGPAEENLCIKAYHLVRNDFPELPPLAIHLYKHIPAGSGLGGGSADGAFMLMLLNEKFNLNLPTQQLLGYASLLGSDCPFFIIDAPCLVTGRGEILDTIAPLLQDFSIVLVLPGIHVNTRAAFERLTLITHPTSIQETLSRPIETWKDNLIRVLWNF